MPLLSEWFNYVSQVREMAKDFASFKMFKFKYDYFMYPMVFKKRTLQYGARAVYSF